MSDNGDGSKVSRSYFQEKKLKRIEEKKKKRHEKLVAKRRAQYVTMGELFDFNKSFQNAVDSNVQNLYQLNVNFRALLKFLVEKKIMNNDEFADMIKKVVSDDKKLHEEQLKKQKEELKTNDKK